MTVLRSLRTDYFDKKSFTISWPSWMRFFWHIVSKNWSIMCSTNNVSISLWNVSLMNFWAKLSQNRYLKTFYRLVVDLKFDIFFSKSVKRSSMNGAMILSNSLEQNERDFRERWAFKNLFTSVFCSTLGSSYWRDL